MNNKTKERVIKLVIYAIVGFAIAFFWNQCRNK